MNDETPSSPLANPSPDNSRKVPSGRGKEWLIEAWQLFKLSPGAWILSMLLFFIILFVVLVVPVVNVFSFVVLTVFIGGLMLGCEQQRNGVRFKVVALFKGFEIGTAKLLVAGLFWLVGNIICSMLALTIASYLGYVPMEVDPQSVMNGTFDPQAYLISLQLPVLLYLGLSIPLLMAFWFAPALIVLRDLKPLEAFKISFKVCNQNMGAFMIYGLAGLVIMIFLVLITQSLAYFVPYLALPINLALNMSFLSVVIISIYTSFEDIFFDSRKATSQSDNIDPPDQITL